jgi:hypothetical protein
VSEPVRRIASTRITAVGVPARLRTYRRRRVSLGDPRARGKGVSCSTVHRVVTRREATRNRHGRRDISASVASTAGHAVRRRRRTRAGPHAGGAAPHHAPGLDESVRPQHVLAPAVGEKKEAGAEPDRRREGRIRVVGLEPVPPLRHAVREGTYSCYSTVSALDASSCASRSASGGKEAQRTRAARSSSVWCGPFAAGHAG